MLANVKNHGTHAVVSFVALLLGASLMRGTSVLAADNGFHATMSGHMLRLDASSAQGRVVFLGSSTFQGLDTAAVTPVALNLSIGGDTLEGLLRRLPEYRSPRLAAGLVVNIGFNDIVATCREVPPARWRALMEALPRSAPLIMVGLQGVTSTKLAESCGGRLSRLLQESNRAIARACTNRPGCRFVPNPVPDQPDAMHRHLQGPDGLHLSPEGYRRLSIAIRNALPAGLQANG